VFLIFPLLDGIVVQLLEQRQFRRRLFRRH
jgi:hypothetical protein